MKHKLCSTLYGWQHRDTFGTVPGKIPKENPEVTSDSRPPSRMLIILTYSDGDARSLVADARGLRRETAPICHPVVWAPHALEWNRNHME